MCNAHLDPVWLWLWQWQDGLGETVSTFRTAVELCEKYDNFVFNHNESLLYEWIKEYQPKLFSRIQKLVKQKKWHIMGGWYLQPDCNPVTLKISDVTVCKDILYAESQCRFDCVTLPVGPAKLEAWVDIEEQKQGFRFIEIEQIE